MAPKTSGNAVPARPKPDENAGAQHEAGGALRLGHQQQAQRVEDGAAEHELSGAEAVGNQSHDGLRQAPDEVLHGDGQGEDLASPAALHGHGLQEQAEAVTDAQRDGDGESAAGENELRRAPA